MLWPIVIFLPTVLCKNLNDEWFLYFIKCPTISSLLQRWVHPSFWFLYSGLVQTCMHYLNLWLKPFSVALLFTCSLLTSRKTIQSQDITDWKEPQEVCSSTTYSRQGHLWDWIRMLRTLSSLFLKISRNGGGTNSLGTWFTKGRS